MISVHLETFKLCLGTDSMDPNSPGGNPAREFGKKLPGVCGYDLPEGKLRRDQVFELAENPEVNTATACAAVLAWGGMRTGYGDLLFENREWLEVACKLRNGKLDRRAAYEHFRELRRHNKLQGMGPVFFTGLICFLMPQPRQPTMCKPGYIMDQWAGNSINLLAGKEIVLMDVDNSRRAKNGNSRLKFAVSNRNDGGNYEDFCEKVNRLAVDLGKCPKRINRALVSCRGESWREHVRKYRLVEFGDQASIG